MTNPNQNTPIFNLIHPFMSLIAIALGYAVGYRFGDSPLGMAFGAAIICAYFVGWEAAQAAYRGMAATGQTWSTLKISSVITPSNWNSHTLIWNLAVPFCVAWGPVIFVLHK